MAQSKEHLQAPAQRGQRRHLYEMDRALVALRTRHGEHDPDLVRLTGLYNNLLRTWSEV